MLTSKLEAIGPQVIWIMILAQLSYQPACQQGRPEEQQLDFKSIEYGESLLRAKPRDSMFPDRQVGEQAIPVPAQVWEESGAWLARFLAEECRFKPDWTVSRFYYRAKSPEEADLVAYEWTCKGRHVRILENRNVVRLTIELKDHEAPEIAVTEACALRGTLPDSQAYEIKFDWARVDRATPDGSALSSNVAADINRLKAWHERVDLRIAQDHVEVLFYKKIPQLVGYRDPSVWFAESGKRRQ